MGDDIQGHPYLVAAPGLEWARILMALTVSEVEEATGDERRRAVGEDLAEADANEPERPVDREVESQGREPEDLERLVERLEVVGERARIVEPLVTGEVGVLSAGGPHAG